MVRSNARIVKLLNSLLLAEYQQRDLYETYDYWLLGALGISIQEHLQEHLKQEMEHARVLQRYLVELGGTPLVKRLGISKITKPTIDKILRLDLKYEEAAVAAYSEAIDLLEKSDFDSLRVDLENILVDEQEHVHDIKRWLQQSRSRRNPFGRCRLCDGQNQVDEYGFCKFCNEDL